MRATVFRPQLRLPAARRTFAARAAVRAGADTQTTLQEMTSRVAELQTAYHAHGRPLVTDAVYDALLTELKATVAQARSQGIDVSSAEAVLSSVPR